jgi:SNF2 family DNA or RNA helicase
MTEMGLGKTYTGSEKLVQLGARVNLVVCQKSKIDDWVQHFETYYRYIDDKRFLSVFDLTDKKQFTPFLATVSFNTGYCVGVINYELLWRRPELSKLTNFTLMLDESSLIQNEKSKRSKFILKQLKPANIILLSGTPTGGKYEKLYSQLKLLGMKLTKTAFYNTYIEYHYENTVGFPLMVIDGYKNVDRLKRKMREYGCNFLKTEDVLDLPEQLFTEVKVKPSTQYRKFKKTRVVDVDDMTLVGDNTLTKMLYERQLCSVYSKAKLDAFKDLVESTEDRLIVFYNFTSELYKLLEVAKTLDKPVSIVNGNSKDLHNYEKCANSITFIQYQAGAMGLNLQLSNKIIYYSPPLSSELYEQSKKRINRIGQSKTCYYYNLIVTNSIEEKIYNNLAMRRDYTQKLFEEDE